MTADAIRWVEMTRQQQQVAWHEIELIIAATVQELGKDITHTLHDRYGIPFMVKISIEYEPLPSPRERIFS